MAVFSKGKKNSKVKSFSSEVKVKLKFKESLYESDCNFLKRKRQLFCQSMVIFLKGKHRFSKAKAFISKRTDNLFWNRKKNYFY